MSTQKPRTSARLENAATPHGATRSNSGRFTKGFPANWFGRPPKPRPPTVDFFGGLSARAIASDPILAAAAKRIPTSAGGTTFGIEAVGLQLLNAALKGSYQAGREFNQRYAAAIKAAKKADREEWLNRMRLKILLTADIIRAEQDQRYTPFLLGRDPRQIIWTETDNVVMIETVELAERIRQLTRLEPRLRAEVQGLDHKIRAAKTMNEHDKLFQEIQSRVRSVNELLSYGMREMPKAEKIVRRLAAEYLVDGRDPVGSRKFED